MGLDIEVVINKLDGLDGRVNTKEPKYYHFSLRNTKYSTGACLSAYNRCSKDKMKDCKNLSAVMVRRHGISFLPESKVPIDCRMLVSNLSVLISGFQSLSWSRQVAVRPLDRGNKWRASVNGLTFKQIFSSLLLDLMIENHICGNYDLRKPLSMLIGINNFRGISSLSCEVLTSSGRSCPPRKRWFVSFLGVKKLLLNLSKRYPIDIKGLFGKK